MIAARGDTGHNRLVFLIEDDEATARFMRLIIEAEGFMLRTLTNREKALEALGDQWPSVIIMDYLMGGLTADVFIDTARERGYDGSILLCTAMKQELDLPVDDVLFKPFDPDELPRRLHRLIAPEPLSGR